MFQNVPAAFAHARYTKTNKDCAESKCAWSFRTYVTATFKTVSWNMGDDYELQVSEYEIKRPLKVSFCLLESSDERTSRFGGQSIKRRRNLSTDVLQDNPEEAKLFSIIGNLSGNDTARVLFCETIQRRIVPI